MTTGVYLPADPQSWWQWWNDTNEVYVEGEKQVATAYYCQELTVVNTPTPIAQDMSTAAARTSTRIAWSRARRSGQSMVL